jgi:hypothetical protein
VARARHGDARRSRRRFLVALLGVTLFACAGRATYVMTATRYQEFPSSPDAAGARRSIDEAWYSTAARSIARGDGVKVTYGGGPAIDDAEHSPFTAIALAPTSLLFDTDTALRLTVALAGALMVLTIGLIADEVAGHRAGLIAAVIAALYPNLWMNDGLVMSETFAGVLTALTVLLAYRFIRRRSPVDILAAGVTAGLATLTRGELVLLIPLLVAPVIWRSGLDRRRALSLTTASVVASLVVVMPYIGYNLTRFSHPVFLSYADADVLTGANCDETYYGPLTGYVDNFCTIPDPTGDLAADAGPKRAQGFHYIRDHLSRLPVVVAARVGRLWGVYRPVQMARIAESEGRPEEAPMAGWSCRGRSSGLQSQARSRSPTRGCNCCRPWHWRSSRPSTPRLSSHPLATASPRRCQSLCSPRSESMPPSARGRGTGRARLGVTSLAPRASRRAHRCPDRASEYPVPG